MSDNVVFNGTSNSPTANTVVATDYVGTGGGGSAHFQRFKLDIGPDGTTIPLAWSGTGMPLGTLPGGSVGVVGTVQGLGTYQLHGTAQTLGTVRALVDAGTVQTLGTFQPHGTGQTLGTYQPLAGSVHPAAPLPGTSHITGTVRVLDPAAVTQSGAWAVSVNGTAQVLGTVQPHGTGQILGTVRALVDAGTVQALGTFQAHGTTQVLGSVSAQGHVAHGAAAAGNPLLISAFGSSGTQAAVDDGDSVRLWADLNGRLQVIGSVTATPTGTTQVLGTIQAHGTGQVLGTVTALPVGTQQVLGTVQAHGTGQVLGTVRALVDAGTVQALGTFQPHGTVQALGTVRALVDAGTVQVLGSVQPVGTVQALGTLQTHGTTHVLGTVSLAGAGTLQGGTVRTLPPTGTALGETFFSTIVTASQSAVTYVAAPGAGTFIRVYDILVSGSAAGTARLLDNAEGTAIGHLHVAANGGWSFNSSRGVRTRAANRPLAFSCSAGTWGVMINYALET